MRVIRRPGPAAGQPGAVVTVGVFDGVHLGHQAIIRRVIEVAREHDWESLVFSFEPTPQEYFRSGRPPSRLMRFREKYRALADLGLQRLYCPPFDARMEKMSPDEFINELLVGMLGARHVVVGDDFRFARDRAGTFDLLVEAGQRLGFGTEKVGSVALDGVRVSSTRIREALAAGDMAAAGRMHAVESGTDSSGLPR